MSEVRLPARKLIAVLGQFLVVIFIATALFRIGVMESKVFSKDFNAILTLSAIAEHKLHEKLINKKDDDFIYEFDKTMQGEIISYINKNNPELDNTRRASRQIVTDWLTTQKLTSDNLRQLSGKGFNNKIPFLFFRSSVQPLKSSRKSEAAAKENPSISLILSEAEYLSELISVLVVTELMNNDIPKQADFKINHGSIMDGYSLNRVFLFKKNTLRLLFTPNPGPQQHLLSDRTIDIPVQTKKISNIQPLSMIEEIQNKDELKNLLSSPDSFIKLKNTYGDLRLDLAKKLSGQRWMESFEKVEMLGFKFSSSYFWLVVFLFNTVTLLASAVHLKSNTEDTDNESTVFGLSYIVESSLTRIVIWCALPATSLLLAFPGTGAISLMFIGYTGAMIIMLSVGVWLYLLSVKVLSNTPR